MKLEYKRELDHNYLILEEEQCEQKEGFEIYMMEANRIPGLLGCTIQRLNQKRRFCYEITSRQSLEILLERKRLSHRDLVQILKGIQRAVSGAREYLLDVNHLMLWPEYMYLNVDKGIPEFCYFPYYEKAIGEQFFDLAEYFLGKLDRQDRAGVELGYEIYKIAGEENGSLEDLLQSEIVREETPLLAASKVRLFREAKEEETHFYVAESSADYRVDSQKKSFWHRKKRNGKNQKEEEPTIMHRTNNENLQGKELKTWSEEYAEEEKGETRLLSGGAERGMVLYGINVSSPAMVVDNDSFLIGKKKDAVDGYIDHPTVSRIHARIEKRENEYYLSDLNSTNGTFVNERLLGMNESVKLKPGDALRFADAEFTIGNA